MPARSGKSIGKTSLWQKLADMLPKKAKVAENPVAKLIKSRPQGEKSHTWITAVWIIGIILLLIVTFWVIHTVLISTPSAGLKQIDDNATSPQSSLPTNPTTTNPTYEVGFFL